MGKKSAVQHSENRLTFPLLEHYVRYRNLTLSFFLSEKWFYPRGAGKCDRVHDFAHLDPQYEHLEADNIVFSFQLPHPGSQLDYS